MKLLSAVLLLVLTIPGLAACGADNSCVSSEECFRGEVCLDQLCQAPPEGSNQTTNHIDNNRNQAPNHATNHDASNSNTTSNSSNGGHTINNPTTNSSTEGVCRDDPFTSMCESDAHSGYTYMYTETGRGCLSGTDFEGGEFVLPDQTLCPLEDVDKYNTNLIPCSNLTFVVEVTVTPQQPCDSDDWEINVRLQGNDCVEGNDKMRCETLPDGSKRATGLLEPSNSIAIPYIDIIPLVENMRFDYDVKLVVRE